MKLQISSLLLSFGKVLYLGIFLNDKFLEFVSFNKYSILELENFNKKKTGFNPIFKIMIIPNDCYIYISQ